MATAVGSDLYAKSVEVINDNLYDLGLSINDKNQEVNTLNLFVMRIDQMQERK